MSREALVLLVCCCDFRDGAERLMPSKSLGNAVIRAFPGLFCILRMCAPRRAAAVVRPRGREKSADRRRRILISRLLIIRASVPRRKSPFPAYFKGFPAVSPLIPSYPAFLKYPVSPHYYSYKGSGFFFFPLPVGRLLLKTARKEVGIVFSELDAIMDMWLHTILNDPKVRGSEYMPVVFYSNMRGMPLLSYTYLARRWGWSKSRVGRFMLKAGEYGIISRVSFSSSRGSVISMCRYREMIYGEGCEELELSRIGEIIGIAKAIDVVEADDSKLDISVESRVPPEKTIGKARKSLKIQVFLVVRSSFFARQIPLVFYSSLDWEMSEQEKSSRDPPKESTLGKEMKS